MKNQVIALMEALRLAQVEIEKLRHGKQGLEATVFAIETILHQPHVDQAIQGLEPFVESPHVAPLHAAEPQGKITAKQRVSGT
jgi:hypothetical protein